MYREKISIWDLFDLDAFPEAREEFVAALAQLGICPRYSECSNTGGNCVECVRRALDRVEEVTIRCDV